MIFVLQGLLIIGFPPLAMWARRTGGTRRLALIACGSLVLVFAAALAATSPRFGNRLGRVEAWRGA